MKESGIKKVMNAYDEYNEYFNKASFFEKIQAVKTTNELFFYNLARAKVSSLKYDGYLMRVKDFGVRIGCDDYYVYLWKHYYGAPFYVGSGKGDRWITKNSRCDDFYHHIDCGDAVVYLILYGADSKTARLYEKYVSVNLTRAGYNLANGDNNIANMTQEAQKRLIKSCDEISCKEITSNVEKTVLEILNNEPICDYRVTSQFLAEYGDNYFSSKYCEAGTKMIV